MLGSNGVERSHVSLCWPVPDDRSAKANINGHVNGSSNGNDTPVAVATVAVTVVTAITLLLCF